MFLSHSDWVLVCDLVSTITIVNYRFACFEFVSTIDAYNFNTSCIYLDET